MSFTEAEAVSRPGSARGDGMMIGGFFSPDDRVAVWRLELLNAEPFCVRLR
jgi:hypothetical protein